MSGLATKPVSARADIIEVGQDGSVIVHRDSALPGGDIGSSGHQDVAIVAAVPDIALTTVSGTTAPALYAAAVLQAAAANDLSPALLEALVWQESRWRPHAVSRSGALGLAQLMPATARSLNVDPRDPIANLTGGARYLRQQLDRFDGNIEKALAAYNAGPGRVAIFGGVPPIAETRAYVAAVVDRLASTPISQAVPGAIR